MKKPMRYGTVGVLMLGLSLSGFGAAHAGPLCTTLNNITLAVFVSCVAPGNDDLPSVQAVLNAVLAPDVILNGALSFSPGPASAGGEFFGDNLAVGFNITPNTVGGTGDTFTFLSLPPGTQFVTMKQGSFFEIFDVGGLAFPFTLDHQIAGNDTSHISTFAGPGGVIPEPTTLLLVGSGLVGLAHVARRRKNR